MFLPNVKTLYQDEHFWLDTIVYISYQAKWSKYQNHKSELVSHLNIDSSEIFGTKT